MIPESTERKRKQRGSILVVVLAVIFALSIMVTYFVEQAVRELKYSALFHERDELRITAYSALESALAALAEVREIDGKLVAEQQGWEQPLEDAGFQAARGLEVGLKIDDVSGQIPVDELDATLLSLVFEQMELDFSVASELVDNYLDWIDSDDLRRLNGAEADYYESLENPYRPANAPLESWQELRLIRGFDEVFFDALGRPNALYDRFIAMVSLRHQGSVNVHAASVDVLEVLARLEGFEARVLSDYLAGSDGVKGSADDRLMETLENPYVVPSGLPRADEERSLAGTEAETLRLIVTVRRGDAVFQLEAVVNTREANPSGPGLLPPSAVFGGEEIGSLEPYPFMILQLNQH